MIGPVLGIETSCDETSAAVVSRGAIAGLAIASQDAHAAYGGVVPEIAARAHLRALDAMASLALDQAGMTLDDLGGVGVTAGPGLVGALLVGVNWGKALAFARELPVIGVHHMEGHLFATALEDPDARPPFVGLLVSGGHTLLLEARAWGDYRLFGATRDDAAGEAFDKVARRLGLGYPGGPEIERAGRAGRAGAIPLPRPMLSTTDGPDDPAYFDMSFSGLKTAVALVADELEEEGRLEDSVADLAAEFQEAVVDVLVEKTMRAVELADVPRVVLGGGVARNTRLQERLAERLGPDRALFVPSPRLATDNAAMIAAVAAHRLEAGERSGWTLNADPGLTFPGLSEAPVGAATPRRS
ncbi:MAG: tRNA (adenosine(37)-N6)-threonylcarbamoyltransferase complex transferase subunit TsaD [Gemmatimonadota bacterium]|nr:tRNA (adenosine(37)-N6)-threonylcarbamoyltransferase complex transferase subunit TsaD [Gemmatimonadota bacterium]